MIAAWFLSDIHLKTQSEWRSEKLLHFLFELRDKKRPATHLIFVGDVFDFWVGNHDFYYRQFQKIIDAIVEVKNQGIDVIYFEGNHDVHIKKFWESRYQIPCYIEANMMTIGHSKVLIEHGDYINPLDRTYHHYLDIIRSPFIRFLSHAIPARPVAWLGERASRWSRKKSTTARNQPSRSERIQKLLHAYAEEKFAERPFDILVTGHVHVRDLHFLPSGTPDHPRPLSVNLGAWNDEVILVGQLADAGAGEAFSFVEI